MKNLKKGESTSKGQVKKVQFLDVELKNYEEGAIYRCPLCGKSFKGYGNDPWPIETYQVCSECDWKVIIPLKNKLIAHRA